MMSQGQLSATDSSATEVQAILEEIREKMGFVPPGLAAVSRTAGGLRAAWAATRAGYLENPLPPLFKEQFMAVVGKYQRTPYSLILRSCSLRQMGMTTQEVYQLLKTAVPRQSLVLDRLRVEGAAWMYQAGWATLSKSLERWILWALVRMTLRKDVRGRCRNALADLLGEPLFDSLVLLSTFAAMQRVWLDAHPDVSSMEDKRVQEQYKQLLREQPLFAELWDSAIQRAERRRVTKRERRLMREIGRLDRIRQALHDSERRFRQVVRNAPFPVMIYAEDGRVVLVNRMWEELSGWDRQAAPTVQHWMQLAELDRTDWSPQDLEALDGWDEVIEEGEYRIRTRCGQVRRWEFSTASLGRLPDGRRAVMRMATDVSDRRELETSLWETNRRLVGILESITDAFCALDRDRRYCYINAKAEQLLRCKREDVLGRRLEEATPSVLKAPAYEHILASMEDGQTRHLDYFSEWMQTHIELHIYGSPDGLSIYFRDITQRKQMEQEIRASERRFRGLFQSGMLGIFFANRVTGEVLECNDAALNLVGYTREDLKLGRLNWMKLTPPEYAALDAEAADRVSSMPLVPYEKEYLHKKGHRVPVLIGGAPITFGEDVVMAFVVDRSREAAAQQKLQDANRLLFTIVEASPCSMVAVGLEGRVVIWNAASERLFGFTKDEVLGKAAPGVREEDMPLFWETIRKTQAGESVTGLRVTCVAKDGRELPLIIEAIPLRDASGRVTGSMATARPACCDAAGASRVTQP